MQAVAETSIFSSLGPLGSCKARPDLVAGSSDLCISEAWPALP